MAAHNDVGAFGEEFVAEVLRISGMDVSPGRRADIQAAYGNRSVEIEVKTARPSLYNGAQKGYQFLLWKRGNKYIRTDFRKADVLVLICLDEDAAEVRACYVLPTTILRQDRRKLTVPYSLETRLESYAWRWDLVADVLGVSRIQDALAHVNNSHSELKRYKSYIGRHRATVLIDVVGGFDVVAFGSVGVWQGRYPRQFLQHCWPGGSTEAELALAHRHRERDGEGQGKRNAKG